MPQGLTLTYESFPHKIKWEKGACGSERNLGLASASPYVHSAAHTQSANKRKDFR
jgi:hypothetical protein